MTVTCYFGFVWASQDVVWTSIFDSNHVVSWSHWSIEDFVAFWTLLAVHGHFWWSFYGDRESPRPCLTCIDDEFWLFTWQRKVKGSQKKWLQTFSSSLLFIIILFNCQVRKRILSAALCKRHWAFVVKFFKRSWLVLFHTRFKTSNSASIPFHRITKFWFDALQQS